MTDKRKPRSRRDIQLSYDYILTWKPMLKGKKKKRKGKNEQKPS